MQVTRKRPQPLKASASSAELRSLSLSLYSNLLRLGRHYPTVATRKNRSLRTGITEEVKQQFRKNQHVADKHTIVQLQQKALQQLQAFEVILSNKWNTTVCTHHTCALILTHQKHAQLHPYMRTLTHLDLFMYKHIERASSWPRASHFRSTHFSNAPHRHTRSRVHHFCAHPHANAQCFYSACTSPVLVL